MTGKRMQKVRSGFITKQEGEAAVAVSIYEVEKGLYVKETTQILNWQMSG